MWDETSRDETSSGTKRPETKHSGTKHPRYEIEMVRNIQHPVMLTGSAVITHDVAIGTASANQNQASDVCEAKYYVRKYCILFAGRI